MLQCGLHVYTAITVYSPQFKIHQLFKFAQISVSKEYVSIGHMYSTLRNQFCDFKTDICHWAGWKVCFVWFGWRCGQTDFSVSVCFVVMGILNAFYLFVGTASLNFAGNCCLLNILLPDSMNGSSSLQALPCSPEIQKRVSPIYVRHTRP